MFANHCNTYSNPRASPTSTRYFVEKLTIWASRHVPSSSRKKNQIPVRFHKDEKKVSMLHLNLPGVDFCHLIATAEGWLTWWPIVSPYYDCELVGEACAASHPSIRRLARLRTWTQSSCSFCQSLRLRCFQRLHRITSIRCWRSTSNLLSNTKITSSTESLV